MFIQSDQSLCSSSKEALGPWLLTEHQVNAFHAGFVVCICYVVGFVVLWLNKTQLRSVVQIRPMPTSSPKVSTNSSKIPINWADPINMHIEFPLIGQFCFTDING